MANTTRPADAHAAPQPALVRRRGGWDITETVLAVLAVLSAIGAPLILHSSSGYGSFIGVIFGAIHGTRRYGWKRLVSFFAVTFVVSNALEDTSIFTGFPFGHYYYTGILHFIKVPLPIGVVYFGIAYVSWLVALTLLDAADRHLDWHARAGRINVFALPALAAAVMTMTDVGNDSLASTLAHGWIWTDGGGLFGVPYTNYLGWWFVTYLFFQIWTLILARSQTRTGAPAATESSSCLPGILIYLSISLAAVFFFMTSPTGTLTDPTGVRWSAHALAESMLVINVFSCIPVALLAIVKIARRDPEHRPAVGEDQASPAVQPGTAEPPAHLEP